MSQHSPTDHPADEEPDYLSPEETIVLIGEPKSLRGELRWHNTGDEKIVLRDAWVHGARATNDDAAGFAGVKSFAPPKSPAPASLSGTIHPGQSQRVPLTFDLGRHTPPGEYRGELKVGGRTHPLVMHVAEAVRLRVSPDQIVIDQSAGATVFKRVVLSNEGNVPLTIGEIGGVMLGEELMLCLGLRATIATVNDKTQPLEELFAEIVRDDARAITRQVGSLEVNNPAAPVVLQPGEVRPLDLEIRLPDNLKSNSRYRGRLPLYTSDLEFVIVPVSDSSKEPSTGPAADSSRY
jgi:hypothetical protein